MCILQIDVIWQSPVSYINTYIENISLPQFSYKFFLYSTGVIL